MSLKSHWNRDAIIEKGKKWCPSFMMLVIVLGVIFWYFTKTEFGKGISDTYHTVYMWIAIVMPIVILVSYFLLFPMRVKLEWVFALVVLTFGIGMTLLVPIMNVPDEDPHSSQIRSIASGWAGYGLTVLDEDGNSTYQSFWKPSYEDNSKVPTGVLTREDYNTIFELFGEEMTEAGWEEETFFHSLEYSEIVYYPAAFVVFVCRIFSVNYYVSLLLARLLNLLLYVIAGVYAIRKMPFRKEVIFAITMIPVYLQQVSSLSADSMIFALILVLVAGSLYLAYTEEITTRDKWLTGALVIAAAIILSRCKYGACLPLVFFAVFVLIKKWKEKDYRIIGFATIFGGFFLGFLPSMYLLTFQTGDVFQNDPYTVGEIITHPWNSFILFGNTIATLWDNIWKSGIGSELGLLSLSMPLYPIAGIVCILAMFVVTNKQETFSRVEKCILFMILFLGVGFIVGGMFIGSTFHGDLIIGGIQGRYFLLFALPFFLLLSTKQIHIKDGSLVRRGLLLSMMVLDYMIFFCLLNRA